MAKNCEIELSGELRCETDDKCCCYQSRAQVLPCATTAQQASDAVNSFPPGWRFQWLENFGNDGWLLVYLVPCDEDDPSGGTNP